MSGLLALLDDVAALAKLAAANLDDVGSQAARVSAKALGVVVDDTAVTPKYVQNLPAARELPIIWKITKGSLFNKLVIVLPVILLLSWAAPWLITPILMLGGAYLCFEGAEKIVHLFQGEHEEHGEAEPKDAAALEQERVSGAVRTDLILSAEIMTIALAAIELPSFLERAAVLVIVALGITLLVYGTVAVLVKLDDLGVAMARSGRLGATRALGRGIVVGMPSVMNVISIVGTAAMLWVGGQIVLHGLETFGPGGPAHWVEHVAEVAGHAVPAAASSAVGWLVSAALSGVFGLALGAALVPIVTKVISPAFAAIMGARGERSH